MEYLSVKEAVALVAKAWECSFYQLQGKRIMFRGNMTTGEKVTLCTPQSKLHPSGFYWVDITEIQFETLQETEKALVVFRLQGRKLVMVKWSELKSYLTPEAMLESVREGNHWKLRIYDDHIKIAKSDNVYKIQTVQY